MVVAELGFGLSGPREFLQIIAGERLQDKGRHFHIGGDGDRRQHGGNIPPIPVIAFHIILGIEKSLAAVVFSHDRCDVYRPCNLRPLCRILQITGNNSAINQGYNSFIALERSDDLPAGTSVKCCELSALACVIKYAPCLDAHEFNVFAFTRTIKGFE